MAKKRGSRYESPGGQAAYFKDRRKRLRYNAISMYGGKCKCCGQSEFGFLTIDHMNGGGKPDRAKHGNTDQFYAWLVKELRPGYQVLCWNCNCARSTMGVCPHEQHDHPLLVGAEPIEKFSTGAVRSGSTAGASNPTDYSQHTAVGMRLLAETQAEGNAKYGRENWRKGIPVSNLLSHSVAHLLALMSGDRSENHLGHAMWGIDKAAHFMETRPDLIDIPGGGLNGEAASSVKPVPADPNPDRNTNCWFCGFGLDTAYVKVIPMRNQYRQAHISCYSNADIAGQEKFDVPPGGPNAK